MTKLVAIVASGATEVEALPHLLRDVEADGIELLRPVRTPRHHRDVRGAEVRSLILAIWYGAIRRPDKFVVIKDADGGDPRDVESRLDAEIEATGIRKQIAAPILIVAAKWHLEAWFFADAPALRDYLKRDLGVVDTSDPDSIENPKLRLKHLLSEPYTAAVSGEISRRVAPSELARSRSFAALERAVRNGRPP